MKNEDVKMTLFKNIMDVTKNFLKQDDKNNLKPDDKNNLKPDDKNDKNNLKPYDKNIELQNNTENLDDNMEEIILVHDGKIKNKEETIPLLQNNLPNNLQNKTEKPKSISSWFSKKFKIRKVEKTKNDFSFLKFW